MREIKPEVTQLFLDNLPMFLFPEDYVVNKSNATPWAKAHFRTVLNQARFIQFPPKNKKETLAREWE